MAEPMTIMAMITTVNMAAFFGSRFARWSASFPSIPVGSFSVEAGRVVSTRRGHHPGRLRSAPESVLGFVAGLLQASGDPA
ncbi:hypothetical protein, partial [Streptomyces sp. KR55]|uniref:hypothetical protein n=1 Tax=Streptomyces sp. KR55 TaxID=3457425 RepID=UPI003FD5AFAD